MKKKLQIKIEPTIDFIPIKARNKRSKYFEFKFLFFRIISDGLF